MMFSFVLNTPHFGDEMIAVHGSLAAFDPASEDWTEYIECLQFYFTANVSLSN